MARLGVFHVCFPCNTERQSTALGWGFLAMQSGEILVLGAGQSQVRNTQQHSFNHTVRCLPVPRAPGKARSCQLAAGGSCIPSTRFKKLTLKVLIYASIPSGQFFLVPSGLDRADSRRILRVPSVLRLGKARLLLGARAAPTVPVHSSLLRCVRKLPAETAVCQRARPVLAGKQSTAN